MAVRDIPNERLFDLVRQCRDMLHADELITDDEYVLLAAATGAVKRLEDYGELRKSFPRGQNR